MKKLWSDLNLNGSTSPRVQPGMGVWGPEGVPSTLNKKVWRIVWWVLTFLAVVGIVVLGAVIFYFLRKGGAA